jgi:hypothetical protein
VLFSFYCHPKKPHQNGEVLKQRQPLNDDSVTILCYILVKSLIMVKRFEFYGFDIIGVLVWCPICQHCRLLSPLEQHNAKLCRGMKNLCYTGSIRYMGIYFEYAVLAGSGNQLISKGFVPKREARNFYCEVWPQSCIPRSDCIFMSFFVKGS